MVARCVEHYERHGILLVGKVHSGDAPCGGSVKVAEGPVAGIVDFKGGVVLEVFGEYLACGCGEVDRQPCQ